MKSNDMVQTRDEIRMRMQQALQESDTDGFYTAFDDMLNHISDDLQQQYEQQIDTLKNEMDGRILSSRGLRQLTNKEHEYYQKVIEAMKSPSPKQALENLDVVMPETIIESVFENLRTNHPLLSKVKFTATTALTKFIYNANADQSAAWGTLTSEITEELFSDFKQVDMTLYKLSAFFAEAKSMLDLGPVWMDRYIREVLYEALANGLEHGIVSGDGKETPIGMIREVGEEVTVTGHRYPEKSKISISDLSPQTVGNLLSIMSLGDNGKPRQIRDLILIVSPQDYFQKIMPATTVMAPDGTYRNNIMPYPMEIIQSRALKRGNAILGMANRYFAGAGMDKNGKIEYSNEYRFLEDERVYLIKLYANGFPMDNTAFLYLDISGIRAAIWDVQTHQPPEPATNANLADLKISGIKLTPAFKADTTSYTATTTKLSNTITAVTADGRAKSTITVDGPDSDPMEINNGSSVDWESGETTVTVKVTAEDGTTTKSYTITVTAPGKKTIKDYPVIDDRH